VGPPGDAVQVDVVGHRHLARVDVENLSPTSFVRNADLDLTVEPPAAPERLVDGVDAVGGADDDDAAPVFESVHQGQQLGDDAVLHVGVLVACARDGVYLVDEEDGRRVGLGLLEGLAQSLLGLALVLRDDFGARDGVEVGVDFVGDGAGDERLACPRRAVEQDAGGRVDAQPAEAFGFGEVPRSSPG